MTALELRKQLKLRVENAIKDLKLSSQEGAEKYIEVFEQSVPQKTKSASRNPDKTDAPYVIIYIDEGNNENVKILFIVAVYDDGGADDLFIILERIRQDLHRTPLVDERFEITDLNWFYNDQATYPYHFGWIESIFSIPQMISEIGEEFI